VKIMKKSILYISVLNLLIGCSLTEQLVRAPNEAENKDKVVTPLEASAQFTRDYQKLLLSNMTNLTRKQNSAGVKGQNINHYVRGITQELIGNLQYVNSSTPLAITSFIFLDSNYEDTNLLGNLISESLMHEVHKFGIPVLDFKTTDFIRVTPKGDFILTRDFLELKPGLPIRYVLLGTLVKHKDGYLVNARIVGLKSKAIVASAQSFIPENIASSLMSSKQGSSVTLLKGS